MLFRRNFFKIKTSYRLILWFFVFFLVAILMWAHLSKIDEVTTAQGKVIPSSKVQVIQNLEGGIVQKIFVEEGQLVKTGEILVQLSDIQFSSDYGVHEKNRLSLEIKIARLQSQSQGKPFVPLSRYIEKIPNIVKTEKRLYQSRIQELGLLNRRRVLLDREIRMTKPLVKSGAVSKVELLRLEQALNELDGKIHAFKSHTLDKLNQAQDDYNQLIARAEKIQDQLRRTTIKSPVSGVVKQIYVNTIGGVIKPGVPIMEIVPLKDTLRIEARVKPNDIGFIRIGMPAMVKFSAYDFTVYGGLEGTVEHISADTSQDDNGNSYYEVWIRTQRAYLKDGKNKLKIIPGMQVSVSILTGKKTVLQYLMKPFLRAKQGALGER